MEKKEKTNLIKLSKIHIYYKGWQKISEWAKIIGIKTFAELEMYCRVWKIDTVGKLIETLANQYLIISKKAEQVC